MDTNTVNGPEGALDWDGVVWRTHEEHVARLRRRIFKATRERRWATVRSLQKMMLGSWSNTLISVRQVTQRNTGRRTAGIDGEVALSGVPPGRWTSKAGSLVGQLRGCSGGDYKKILHCGVPG